LFIPKPGGKLRPRCNFRLRTETTVTNDVPLQHIDDSVGMLHRKHALSARAVQLVVHTLCLDRQYLKNGGQHTLWSLRVQSDVFRLSQRLGHKANPILIEYHIQGLFKQVGDCLSGK
jgi:hypothetical protein